MLGSGARAFYRWGRPTPSGTSGCLLPCWTSPLTCIFCKIAAGDLPSERVFESPDVLVIRDIRPQAPTHLLVIPRVHVESMDELEDVGLGGELLAVARQVACEAGLARGWRLITNIGAEGGQEVPHLHFHVLGGRPLGPMLSQA